MTTSSTFKMARVGHVCNTVLGKMLQTIPKTPGDQEVPYLRAGLLETLSDLAEMPTMYAQDSEVRALGLREGDLIVAEGGDVGRSEMAPRIPQGTIFQNSLHRIRLRASGDIRFVRYALSSIYSSGWLDVLCNRATFGHLTVEKLRHLHIPWPRPSQQAAIADYLDTETNRIDTLITKKHRMIELLEERRRTLITVVVTGCDTPGSWTRSPSNSARYSSSSHHPFQDPNPPRRGDPEMVRLKHLAGLRVECASSGERPYVALEHIASWTGALVDGTELPVRTPSRTGMASVEPGDVLYGKLRPYLAKTWVVDRPALASTELMCMRPRTGVDSRWLGYLTMATPFVGWAVATSEGTKMPRTSWEKVREYRLRFPSDSEQRAIAYYLDTETSHIDTLITKTRQAISLLTERRQALITATVTGESVAE